MKRNRILIVFALLAVIALGLASRKFPWMFPTILGKYPGDALWALMVFLGWGLIKPRTSSFHIAALALATSCIVEFSQLYQAPWINSIRSTTPGHLVLGSTFSWLDILAYSVGVLLGLLIEYLVITTRLTIGSTRIAYGDRVNLYR